MSALVILECNACGVITPPWPTAERAREEAGPDGWAVDVDGSDIDYCPRCTAPANAVASNAGAVRSLPPAPVSRLEAARRGVGQLRDALDAIAKLAPDTTPQAVASVAALGAIRARQLLAELAA